MRTEQMTLQVAQEASSAATFIFQGVPEGAANQIRSISAASGFSNPPVECAAWIIKSDPSTVQNVWEWELGERYQALGATLTGLSALSDEDELKIDVSVYHAASYVAGKLKGHLIPAPRIFVHGPVSVVFSWTSNVYNFYLTVEQDGISGLLSSQNRIIQRIDYATSELPNTLFLLPPIQSSIFNSPVTLSNSVGSD